MSSVNSNQVADLELVTSTEDKNKMDNLNTDLQEVNGTGSDTQTAIAAANSSIILDNASARLTEFAVASRERNRDFHQLFTRKNPVESNNNSDESDNRVSDRVSEEDSDFEVLAHINSLDHPGLIVAGIFAWPLN